MLTLTLGAWLVGSTVDVRQFYPIRPASGVTMKKSKRRDLRHLNGQDGISRKHAGGGATHRSQGRLSRFPDKASRQRTIDRIRGIRPTERSGQDWYLLGETLTLESLLQDDSDLRNEAIEALQAAAEATPCVPDALMQLTLLFNFQGLPGVGLQYARKAVELMPDYSDAWKFLGHTLSQQNKSEEAIKCYRRATECAGCATSVHEKLAAMEADPKTAERHHIILPILLEFPTGIQRTQASLEEESLLNLMVHRQLLKIRPDDKELLWSATRHAYQLRMFTEAVRYAGHLTALDATNGEVWELLGLIAEKTDKKTEALEHYNRALQCDPTREVAGVNAANILMASGCTIEARAYLRQVLEVNPENPSALTNYANTIAELEQDFELELSFHRRAIAAGAQGPEIAISFCCALFQAGHLDEFHKQFERNRKLIHAAAVSGTDPRVHLYWTLLSAVSETLMTARWDPARALGMMHTLAELPKLHPQFELKVLSGPGVRAILERIWSLRTHINHLSPAQQAEFDLGFASIAMDFECFTEAIPAWERLQNGHFPEVFPITNLVICLADSGRRKDALVLAEQRGHHEPHLPAIRASLLRTTGRPEDSFTAFSQLLPHNVADEHHAIEAIRLAADLGKTETAKQWLSDCRKAVPNASTWQLLLSYCQHRGGLFFDSENTLAAAILELPTDTANSLDELLRLQTPPQRSPDAAPDLWVQLSILLLNHNHHAAFTELQLKLQRWQFQSIDNNVIFAAAQRRAGQLDRAATVIAAMPRLPHVLIEHALIRTANEDWQAALSFADEVLGNADGRFTYQHPEGNPRVLARMIQSLACMVQADPVTALQQIESGLEEDPFCEAALLQKLSVLEALGRDAEAQLIEQVVLQLSPGQPDALHRCVVRQVESRRFDVADELLARHRAPLRQRHRSDLESYLSNKVARARLQDIGGPSSAPPELHWIQQLQKPSRDWLQSVRLLEVQSERLTEAIMLYLAKITELELAVRITEPFRSTISERIMEEGERDVPGFVIAWRCGHPPALSAVSRALRRAAEPNRGRESELMVMWRQYLKRLPPPLSTALRSRKFLDELDFLAGQRNSAAHVSKVAADAVRRAARAIINNSKPGVLLEAVGIFDSPE